MTQSEHAFKGMRAVALDDVAFDDMSVDAMQTIVVGDDGANRVGRAVDHEDKRIGISSVIELNFRVFCLDGGRRR